MSLNIIIASANNSFVEEIKTVDELQKEKFSIFVVQDFNDLGLSIKKNNPFLLLTDLWLTDHKKGNYASTFDQDLVKQLRTVYPDLQVIVFADSRSPYIAYELYQVGVLAYFSSFDTRSLKTLIKKAQLYHEVLDLTVSKTEPSNILDKLNESDYCITKNSKLEKVYIRALRYSETDSPILILGETGTGKEHLASFIHYNSPRKNKKFVTIDLSTAPDKLFETTLFGSKKGAFTGSTENVAGIVEDAEGGTLFIDEIGNISTHFQSKLLRLVENLEYRRVGDTKVLRANIRIISATNKSKNELETGTDFRNDLFYRLSKLILKLPNLKERHVDEKIKLVNYFLNALSYEYKRGHKKFDRTALRFIVEYDWPGNIRELKKVLFNAYMDSNSEIISGRELVKIINEELN